MSTHYTDTSTFVSQCLLFVLSRKLQTRFYKSLAAIESKRLLEDSLQHYRKARQALLDGFLPENHPEIRKIDRMIQTINAYYTITASSEFREKERLRAKARHDEAQALYNA